MSKEGKATGPEGPADIDQVPLILRREIEARVLGPVLAALEARFGADEVRRTVRAAIESLAREEGARRARAAGRADLTAFAALLDVWRAGGALEIEMIEAGPRRLAFDVTRCRYAELYRALGLGEWGEILSCCRDGALVAGFNPSIRFERRQTIMQGADRCTFRYELDAEADPPARREDA